MPDIRFGFVVFLVKIFLRLSVVECYSNWIGNLSLYEEVKCGDSDCGYNWVDVRNLSLDRRKDSWKVSGIIIYYLLFSF